MWCLYLAILVLWIRGCGQISTIGHVVFVPYLIIACQPSLLTLHPPTTAVSLLLLGVHAGITELCFFISREWLPIRFLFIVLWLLWCFWAILGGISHFPTTITHWSPLLTNVLQVLHLISYWKFLERLERSLHLESILYIFFYIQCNCYDFVQGCMSHRLHLCLDKSL